MMKLKEKLRPGTKAIPKATTATPESPAQPPLPAETADAQKATPGTGLGIKTSQEEKRWKSKLYTQIIEELDLSLIKEMEEMEVRQQIHSHLQNIIHSENIPLAASARERVTQQVENEIIGMGPLEPLLNDPTVSDILVNGPDSIFVERFGKLETTDITFDSAEHLMHIIDRIVSLVGRRIDEASPMVDARLSDGSRVNAIIPPLAVDAPALSIRRFPGHMLLLADLVEKGALTEQASLTLQAAIKARLNVVVSGGTGSGKTTLMNALSAFIPSDERIITIEDSAELQLQQEHVVRLETRQANIEGKGEISQRELVKNCLRMRPDRIILGEVRGAEALDMLQAMDTGHDGSITTIHANTPRDAVKRIENMVAMTGLGLPTSAVRSQIASAIDLVIQAERMEDGGRRITSIQEINGMEGEIILMSEIFKFNRQGRSEDGKVLGQMDATGIVPKFFTRLTERGIALDRKIFASDKTERRQHDRRFQPG
ncbi:MAG: CpaF family protein [Thiolinea sp.]